MPGGIAGCDGLSIERAIVAMEALRERLLY